jgi:hypothetical protein
MAPPGCCRFRLETWKGWRMAYLFKTIRYGIFKPTGTVEIPFLGAKVGEFSSWTLQRRGDQGPEAGLYDLHAVFSFVSEALWHDDEYDKQILLSLSPSKQFRVQQESGMRTVLSERSLLMEGVTIHDAPRR